MNENLQIIDKIWFSNPTLKSGEIMGIVIARDLLTKEENAYVGKATSGDEETDTEAILAWGTKMNREVLKSLLS